MSLLSRLQLAAIALCSKDESRSHQARTSLHVIGTSVEVTDGHIAVRVTRTDGVQDNDFPAILPNHAAEPGSVSIPRDAVTKALISIPKKVTHTILQNAIVRQDGTDILIGTTDLTTPQVLTIAPTEGTFPSFEQVIPKKEDGMFSIGLDPRLLIEVCKYAAQFNNDRHSHNKAVEFTFYDSTKSIRMDWHNAEHDAIGIVMPMRIENAKAMPGVSKLALDFVAAHAAGPQVLRAFIGGLLRDEATAKAAAKRLSQEAKAAAKRLSQEAKAAAKRLSQEAKAAEDKRAKQAKATR